MIEIKKLKQLIQLMKDNGLTELDLRDTDGQVTLKRDAPGGPAGAPAHPPPVPAAPHPPAPAAAGGAGSVEPAAEAADEGFVEIPSPMVGTFYTAASPDAEPFVKIGSRIDPETVVCIVEAMKVFNEIKAEVAGTIEKVLVGNGQAVEYGQPLYLVKPEG